MAHVYIDRTDDGRIAVRVMTGIKGDKTTVFEGRHDAEAFAEQKMGRTGMICSTLDMSPEQLAEHRARLARRAAALASIAA